MNTKEALILLNSVDCIGSVRLKKLLSVFVEPMAILKASVGELTSTGAVTPLMAKRVAEAPKRFNVEREMQRAEKAGVRILIETDEDYPSLLKEIYDPPIVLYVKGSLQEADQNAVGVVGSRGASYYGLSCARQFSETLARFGLTIVSGMARGIDTASHRAALDVGGRTFAVLGSGLNRIYPPENKELFREIGEKGAVLSQFPMDTAPLPKNFPIRNRIISGLSLGILIVEASQKSGALITARFGLEQGREIFAIPGKLSSETSSGSNDLIKDGARMVTDPQEILEELKNRLSVRFPSGTRKDGKARARKDLSESESKILERLSDEPKDADILSAETGLPISDLMASLMRMELLKVVKQLPGKTFVKV